MTLRPHGPLFVLLAVSCTGVFEADLGTGSSPTPAQPPPASAGEPDYGSWIPSAAADPDVAAALPVRLLNRVEYNNTIRDLLADGSNPANAFPVESSAETGFAKVQKIDDVSVGAYFDAAEAIATRATANVPKLLGCDPAMAAGEESCLRKFVTAFGRRAYRRPLSAAEIEEHLDLYRTKLRAELMLPPGQAVRALLTAMLQSPFFLYRWEQAWSTGPRNGRGIVALNPFHLASQLSYFVWSSMPDEALLAAAERGELRTPEQVEAQARRLVADSRAERTVASFHEQWLRLGRLSGALRNGRLYPMWNAALGEAMLSEVRRFTSEVVLRRDGRLGTLFASTSTFVNGPLAALYGVPGSAAASSSFAATLPTDQRAGLLTLAGVMAAHADENEPSPILRGQFVREHVMCAHIPPPPGMIPDLAPPNPNVPKRQRFAAHSSDGACRACHELMDPIGFGFENYDAIGAFRTTDGKFPVEPGGTVTALDGGEHAFATPLELVRLLAGSAQVRACVARQWFRYALARNEGPDDDHSLATAFAAFRASDFDIRELLVALARSRAFTHRALAEAEEVGP